MLKYLALLWILCFMLASCTSKIAEHSFLVPPLKETPADIGLPFEKIFVRCGNKEFLGWIVHAKIDSNSQAYSLMLFTGIGGGVSDWVDVQRSLYENGITSLVFNYGDLKDTVTSVLTKMGPAVPPSRKWNAPPRNSLMS